MRLISIITPCYDEEENAEEAYRQVKALFDKLPQYRYEHIFIDNSSRDATGQILRRLAERDRNVKVIYNSRNFGHIRSPHHALLQARGDAAVFIVADLQDPIEMVPQFLQKWEEGYQVVMGVKVRSAEHPFMFALRRTYYRIVNRLADIELTNNFYGFGLFDRVVIEAIRQMDDPYPYGRGMISEVGFNSTKLEYNQRRRERGITKNNFYTLYDMAMLGIISHSKVPLRLATMLGFTASALAFVIGFGYLVAKLLFWDRFSFGLAPLMIGLFMFASVQLFFIGILGEYIGFIHTLCQRRPLVFERERINFEFGAEPPPAPKPSGRADAAMARSGGVDPDSVEDRISTGSR